MDHDEAVRLKATERYLLDELESDQRDEFEEHFFDCQDCAMDLRAGAMLVEQTKAVLAETPAPARKLEPGKSSTRWFGWLRPAFALPVMAVLLAVIGYQNFIQIPHREQAANQMRDLPHASINVRTRGGSAQQITHKPGEDVLLLLNIPPNPSYLYSSSHSSSPSLLSYINPSYSSYILELYNQAGRLQWSLKIPASSQDDLYPIKIPGAGLEQGTYKLEVSGVNAAGQSSKLDSSTIELQIQK